MTPEYGQQYLFVGLLAVATVGFGVAPLILARWLAPRNPGPSKQQAYECGMEGTGESWVRFRAQYILYALLFVLFDIEVIFLFPWALVWRTLGWAAFLEMMVFLGVLFVGLIYAWKKGALEWS